MASGSESDDLSFSDSEMGLQSIARAAELSDEEEAASDYDSAAPVDRRRRYTIEEESGSDNDSADPINRRRRRNIIDSESGEDSEQELVPHIQTYSDQVSDSEERENSEGNHGHRTAIAPLPRARNRRIQDSDSESNKSSVAPPAKRRTVVLDSDEEVEEESVKEDLAEGQEVEYDSEGYPLEDLHYGEEHSTSPEAAPTYSDDWEE